MDADIVMSPENDAGDVDCNAVLNSRFWQWLSRLCGSGNINQESVFDDQTSPRSKRRNVDGRVYLRRDPVLKKRKKSCHFHVGLGPQV